MNKEEIQNTLFHLQDTAYREFQKKLIPTIASDRLIGVRTPQLRKLAKELGQADARAFLDELPHTYFDENQLHAFILSDIKDEEDCLKEVNRFLPYIDNWATCDQLSPNVLRKHPKNLMDQIRKWIDSKETYTVRFGIGMMMQHYLNDAFDPTYPEMVAQIQSDEYYVNMMIAWYFATALAKQYDAVLPFIQEKRLNTWTHNKTIQKALESFRIPLAHKEYLKGLKIKETGVSSS